uniref:Uncharacterized protein n=1 Tax=Aquisalinus luteolus TaxID=1566827 RepID=A0A8J3A583_9PROT|nr:hypothetical protein GCM10011355_27180 [Aquisalinus luteolus]
MKRWIAALALICLPSILTACQTSPSVEYVEIPVEVPVVITPPYDMVKQRCELFLTDSQIITVLEGLVGYSDCLEAQRLELEEWVRAQA